MKLQRRRRRPITPVVLPWPTDSSNCVCSSCQLPNCLRLGGQNFLLLLLVGGHRCIRENNWLPLQKYWPFFANYYFSPLRWWSTNLFSYYFT